MADKIKIAEIEINYSAAIKETAEFKKKGAALKKQLDELKKSGQENTAEYIKLTAEYKAINDQVRQNETQLKKYEIAQNNEGKTVSELVKQNAALSAERDKQNIKTQEGKDKVEAINKIINDNNKIIQENSDKLKQQKMNVGNYTDSVKDALTQTGIWGSESQSAMDKIKGGFNGIKDFGSKLIPTFSTLKGAIASTGIGLLLIAFTSLVSYFTKSLEGSKALKAGFAALGAVVDTLMGVLTKTGELLVDIVTLNWGNLNNDLSSIGDNFKNIASNAKEAYDISKAEFQLAKDKRKNLVDEATISRDIAKLRLDASDKTKSNKERIDALTKSLEKEKILTQEKVAIAQKELDINQRNIALSEKEGKKASKDDKDAVAQLTAAKINAETEEFQRSKRQVAQLTMLKKELNDKDIEMHKAAIEAKIKNEEAYLQSLILKYDENSQQRLDAELKYLETKHKNDLKAEKLTVGEKALINQQYINAKKEAELKYQEYQLKLSQDNLNLELELYIQKNQSKLNSDIAYTDESVKNEMTRLNREESNRALAIEQTIFDDKEKELALLQNSQQYADARKNVTDAYNAQKLQALQTNYENELALAEGNVFAQIDIQKKQLDTQRDQELKAAEATGADKQLILDKYNQAEIALEQAKTDAKLSLAEGFAGNIATIFGEQTAIGKAAAVAETTINTYRSATAAYAALSGIPVAGPALGAAAAAAAIVAGLSNVKKILSVNTKVSKNSSGSNSGGGGSYTSTSSTAQTMNTNAGSIGAGIIARDSYASNSLTTSDKILVVDDVTYKQNENNRKIQASNL